jgi:hypothetical protein
VTDLQYLTEPVDEMEDVTGVFYGGRGQVGQQIVVTNRRLLIGPIDTRVALDIEAYLADQASGGSGGLIKDVLGHYAPMAPKTLWLRHVSSVRPTHNAGLLRAPGLEVTTDTGETIKLVIVVSATTMSRDPRNNVMRDQAVTVITKAVADAQAAAPPRSG